jgi:hypothetical protein
MILKSTSAVDLNCLNFRLWAYWSRLLEHRGNLFLILILGRNKIELKVLCPNPVSCEESLMRKSGHLKGISFKLYQVI